MDKMIELQFFDKRVNVVKSINMYIVVTRGKK